MSQDLQAIRFFEESLGLCQELASEDPAYNQQYYNTLYSLIQSYHRTHNYIKCYESCDAFALFLMQQKENTDSWGEVYAKVLGTQSIQAIFLKKYVEAEQQADGALQKDLSQQWIFSSLAAAKLFQGKYDEAEEIYIHMKSELREVFLRDLNDFDASGVIPVEYADDVKRIKLLLME